MRAWNPPFPPPSSVGLYERQVEDVLLPEGQWDGRFWRNPETGKLCEIQRCEWREK